MMVVPPTSLTYRDLYVQLHVGCLYIYTDQTECRETLTQYEAQCVCGKLCSKVLGQCHGMSSASNHAQSLTKISRQSHLLDVSFAGSPPIFIRPRFLEVLVKRGHGVNTSHGTQGATPT